MANSAVDLILAQRIENKLDLFAQGLCERKPGLKELAELLSGYFSAYGDVGFDELVSMLFKHSTTIPDARPEEVVEVAEVKSNDPVLVPRQARGSLDIRSRLITFINQNANTSFRMICKEFGQEMSEQNIRYHLNWLLQFGAIVQPSRGMYSLKSAE